MKRIGVTQRVSVTQDTQERRDALDQMWAAFLLKCGLLAVPLPNHLPSVKALLREAPFDGILLTGGNDLVKYGGDAPERDRVERHLIRWATENKKPLLGVCRGMQVLQDTFGVPLEKVEGHVAASMKLAISGESRVVNSYHHFGARRTAPQLEVWALSADGVVKAVRHRSRRLLGIMWHPERLKPFAREDVSLFKKWFSALQAGKGKK